MSNRAMSNRAISKTLKWGILGTSFISGVMADAIAEEGETEVCAVAARRQDTLDSFARQYQIPKQYTDYDELIKDPEVDIVYIALPNHLHHDYIIKAANAGKAILCEKSLSVDMEKTDAALKAVKETGVFFSEGLMYLNHPIISEMLSALQSGVIGEVKSVSGQYVAAIDEFVNPGSKGALYNLGCYPVSLAHLILTRSFGAEVFKNSEVTAFGHRGKDGNICDSSMNMKLENGVLVRLHTAEDHGLFSQFTVLGTEGSLTFNSNPWLPEAGGNSFSVALYEQDEKKVPVEAEGNGFFYQVRNIRSAILAGEKSLSGTAATPEDSREIMRLLTGWEAAAEQ